MNVDSDKIGVLIDQIEKDRCADNIVSISPVKVYNDINTINKKIKSGMTLDQALAEATYTEKLYIQQPLGETKQ